MSEKIPLWNSTATTTPSSSSSTNSHPYIYSKISSPSCMENGHVPLRLNNNNSNGGISNSNSSSLYASSSINGNSNNGNVITKCCFHLLKCVNVRRCVAVLVLLTVVTIVYYTHYVDNSAFVG